MATALEPPRTKQKLEEPADADIREDTDGVLKAEKGQVPSIDKSTPFTCSWHVDFPTEEAAVIVYKTLSVDPEEQRPAELTKALANGLCTGLVVAGKRC